MPMPTTRRGRFLFYKARAKRRTKKCHQRRQRVGSPVTNGHNATNRAIDKSGETLQMPRVYPRHFPEKWMDAAEWLLHGWTPPAKRKWGWLGDGTWVDAPLGSRGHSRVAVVGYHDRRALSIPRLRHLPRLPYLHPKESLDKGNFYQPDFYPSGGPSWCSTLP